MPTFWGLTTVNVLYICVFSCILLEIKLLLLLAASNHSQRWPPSCSEWCPIPCSHQTDCHVQRCATWFSNCYPPALQPPLTIPDATGHGQIFYALDMEGAIKTTCSCHHCNFLKYIPPPLVPQFSCSPPGIIGSFFALHVMRRAGQCILILCETVSSYAATRLIGNEQHQTSRDSILSLVTEMRSCCRSVEVRVDNASGLKALESDSVLKSHDIILVFGETKNVNKNPVAEYAVKELGLECLHICPEGGPVTTVTLALAMANMNSRIRHHGLSAKEVWTQRDQETGDQLALDDRQIILKQHCECSLNHGGSALSKSKCKGSYTLPHIQVSDLVYIVIDGDKTKAREKYLVSDLCSDNMCLVRKFTKSQWPSIDCPYLTLSSHHSHHPQVHVMSLLPHAGSLIHPHPLSHYSLNCITVAKKRHCPPPGFHGTATHLISGREMVSGWWTNHASTIWFFFFSLILADRSLIGVICEVSSSWLA